MVQAPIGAGPASAPAGDFVLILSCPDRPGIVHAVSGFLVSTAATSSRASSTATGSPRRFFMRIDFEIEGEASAEDLRAQFADVAARFEMEFELWARPGAVQDTDHGLQAAALPQRPAVPCADRALQIDATAIVSNHPDAGRSPRRTASTFHHVPGHPRHQGRRGEAS